MAAVEAARGAAALSLPRLLPMALVTAVAGGWAVAPVVAVKVEGSAVLLQPGSRVGFYARSAGQVQAVLRRVGDAVEPGQPLLTLNRVDQAAAGTGAVGPDPRALERQGQAISRQQEALRAQIAAVRTTNQPVLQQVRALNTLRREEVIPRYSPLWVSAQNLYLANQSTIRGLQGQLAQLDVSQAELDAQRDSQLVLAPRAGTLLSWAVTPGEAVAPGQRIASLGSPDGQASRNAVAVFAAADASRLRPGLAIELAPQFQSRNDYGGSAARYGHIEGRITGLSPASLNMAALTSVVGDGELAASLVARSRQEGFGSGGDPLETAPDKLTAPVVLAQVALEAAPTASGLRWTRGPGPAFRLSSGTPATVDVEVERRSLLSYLTPFLRWIGGMTP